MWVQAHQRRRAWTVGRTIAAGAFLLAWLVVGGASLMAAPSPAAAAAARPVAPAAQEHAAAPLQAGTADEVSDQSIHGEPWWKGLARLFNFLIVAGVLVYFLRAPIAAYLARRSTEIRSDLTKAAEAREAATAQLETIERKMKALPGEIEALKARGADEIAAEQVRIRDAAEAERARLLEQARRDIDLQVRAAERDLVARAAELTVALAAERVRRTITTEDQERLVDRYLTNVGTGT